jgi:hypothetical protein
MSGFLGIDHPLVVVRDLAATRARCLAIGFSMTPVTQHPWGTGTSIAVFDRCLLELMGVTDESLIDARPAGDFHFGRTIRDHLAEREGISLTALYSENAEADAARVMARGIASQGRIEFGRDITLPDGRPDRTATTLRIIADPELPRLSNFICQQHRPDLIYVPRWMEHANTAIGICQVAILAGRADQPRVRRRLAALYGEEAVREDAAGFSVQTGNGRFLVGDLAAIEALYGPLPPDLARETQPCSVSIHIRVRSLAAALGCVTAAGFAPRRQDGGVAVMEPGFLGNAFLAFEEG